MPYSSDVEPVHVWVTGSAFAGSGSTLTPGMKNNLIHLRTMDLVGEGSSLVGVSA